MRRLVGGENRVGGDPDSVVGVHRGNTSDMFAWPPLPGLNKNSRRRPQEQQWYKVTGRVVDVMVQEDGDIHFELQDATSTKRGHILVEVHLGRPWCQLRRIVFSWTMKGTRFKRFQALVLSPCANSRL